MSYNPKIEGLEGKNIEVQIGFWTGPKLLINGESAAKGRKRGEMIIPLNDGRQVTATWKAQALGLDIPQLIVDGKVINLVEPLKWYQWIWGSWPIILLFTGGALGALAGMLSVVINTRVFRTEMNDILKYIVSGAVTVLAVAAYLVAAIILSTLING
jgi:hypothetical protein